MPKLNTTIDNIELKSNKVISTSDPSTWTDEQYPSAKALLDIAHPIGSILTTSTNTDPSATWGGSWKLVDKAFEEKYITVDSTYWTATNAVLGINSNVLLTDHMISMRLNFTSTAEFNDEPKELGTLNLRMCGIDALSHAVFYDPIISDLGNCTMNFRMTQEGVVSIHEVLNIDGTHSMAAGSDFYINITQPIAHGKMLDSFCDKFYWKRLT